MPKSVSDTYKVSNNRSGSRGGTARAAAASLVKKAAKTLGKKQPTENTGTKTNPPSPSKDLQLQSSKRRDLKATPPTHAHTKAKEWAGRDAVPKPADDPVAGLNSGTGALGEGDGPPKPTDLESSAKTLFPISTGDKKKVAPKSKTTDFFAFGQDEALEVALAQAKLERELAEQEAKTSDDEVKSDVNNDSPVDEYSGEVAVVADDDGNVDDGADEEDKEDEEPIRAEEEKLTSEIKEAVSNPQVFLAEYHRIMELRAQADSVFLQRSSGCTLLSFPRLCRQLHIDAHS